MINRLPRLLLCAVAAVILSLSTSGSLLADTTVELVPGTVPLSAEAEATLIQTIAAKRGLFPDAQYFSVSWAEQHGRWHLISVVGLAQLDDEVGWRLTDATWTGTIVLRRGITWRGAIQGTPAFTTLLADMPDRVLSEQARVNLDPLTTNEIETKASTNYIFPWPGETAMYYGTKGVHENGFESVGFGDWLAVDWVSNGDTTAGHAPNSLRASQAGTVTYLCRDSTALAVQIGNFMYTHITDDDTMTYGRAFAQGDEIGQMRPGSFSERCGWASQGAEWFHVHWGFKNEPLTVSGWTLDFASGMWSRSGQSVGPGGWMVADPFDDGGSGGGGEGGGEGEESGVCTPGTTLVCDGGFEEPDIPDWALSGNDGQYCDAQVAHTGSCGLLFRATDGQRMELAVQKILLSEPGAAGDTVTLAYRIRMKDLANEGVAGMQIRLKNTTTGESEIDRCTFGMRGDFNWAQLTCSFIATVDGYDTIILHAGMVNINSGFLLFDEVSVTIDPAATP